MTKPKKPPPQQATIESFVLCNLHWGKVEQQSLNLTFPLTSQVKFTLKGKGEIHLVGYYEPIEDPYDFSSDEDLDEDDDVEEELKQKYGNSGLQVREITSDDDDDEDDEDDEEDEEETPNGTTVQHKQNPKQQIEHAKKGQKRSIPITDAKEGKKQKTEPTQKVVAGEFKCVACGKSFKEEKGLQQHSVAKHAAGTKEQKAS